MGWSFIISNTALGDPPKNSKGSQTILPAEVIYVQAFDPMGTFHIQSTRRDYSLKPLTMPVMPYQPLKNQR